MGLVDPQGRPLPPSDVAQKQERLSRLDSRVRGVAEQLTRRADEEGDWFACFECVALDSQYAGERMVLIYGRDDWDKIPLESQAPDTNSFGLGWKFRLKQKFREAVPAAAWLYRQEEARRD